MYDLMQTRTRLSVKEQELLDFAYNAQCGDNFVYASCKSAKPISLMALARKCFENGLVHLMQKRTEQGFIYVAIKRKRR